jgi:Glu-tRNA(Gln) amidotransferase subunit E-like FAD-binding protein
MTLFFGTSSFIAILVIIFSLTMYSCNTNAKSSDTQTVSIDSLTMSPEVHDSLNDDQTTKVKKIYNAFSEVNPSTLEETISNFKRDQNPDNEINVWLNMATTYENFISTRPSKLDLDKKKEVYKLILIRSMMSADEAKSQAGLKLLNDNEIKEILDGYDNAPKPLTVEKK